MNSHKYKDKEILTRKEAADFLSLKYSTLDRWAANGRQDLPYFKMGKFTYYKKDDLIKLCDQLTINRYKREDENVEEAIADENLEAIIKKIK